MDVFRLVSKILSGRLYNFKLNMIVKLRRVFCMQDYHVPLNASFANYIIASCSRPLDSKRMSGQLLGYSLASAPSPAVSGKDSLPSFAAKKIVDPGNISFSSIGGRR